MIVEVWGRAGRTNLVGPGFYAGDEVWDFEAGPYEESVSTDRVCRWAFYPKPSWVEP